MRRPITSTALLFVFVAIAALLGGSSTQAKAKQEQSIPWVPEINLCVDFGDGIFCAPGDTDGDGHTDLQETAVGSDLSNATSTPEYGLYDEQTGLRTCRDGIDNDKDGRIDQRDSGCHVTCGDYAGHAQCADPDHDGFKNYVEVTYGSNPKNHSSTPESFFVGTCDDGADNDGDGFTDAADSGCGFSNCIDFDPDSDCLPF